jgi:hypothetical protein
MIIKCTHCGKKVDKRSGHVNRANKLGARLFCNRTCYGLDKRHNRSLDEQKEVKRIYDLEYCKNNYIKRKSQQKEWFDQDYAKHPEKYKERRKAKYEAHLKYLSTDKYKAKKKKYDREFRAKKKYGEFWESFIHLQDIDKFIDNREVKLQLCLTNKNQKRKRNYERINSSKLERSPLGNS